MRVHLSFTGAVAVAAAAALALPAAGAAAGSSTAATSASPEAHHTNNIVTTDKWGDIVAYTNTINVFGGSGEPVPGYGFLLNDELTDFDFAPESDPTSHPPNTPSPTPTSPARANSRARSGRIQSIAEPTRLYGGSALVVHPDK